MIKLLPIEKAVLEKLLEGTHPLLVSLRLQLEHCIVATRELTGCGFYTTLTVLDDTPRIDGLNVQFGDVVAEIAGLKNGAGFLLYLKDGLLDMLEGYSFDEPWPEAVDAFNLRYNNVGSRDFGDLPVTMGAVPRS